jgi:hypothetical protein
LLVAVVQGVMRPQAYMVLVAVVAVVAVQFEHTQRHLFLAHSLLRLVGQVLHHLLEVQ